MRNEKEKGERQGFHLPGLPTIRKSRKALTLLFAGTAVIVLLAVLIVVGGAALILFNAGVLSPEDLPRESGNRVIVLMLVVSLFVGIGFSYFLGWIFTRPLNIIINNMNRLATGDFKARIRFDSVFDRHPTVAELSRAFNTMAEELENTEMLRSDFVNNFSHEFKTPIVSIAGFAKLLKSGDLSDDEREEYINIIEEESLRLSDMANNVLSLTKIENQRILSGLATFNLSEQIRTCFVILESKWSGRDLDFSLDFDEYDVTANEEMLKQVWLNLIDNALKFTPEGGRIAVTIKRDRALAVSVFNSGSFIPEENRERVFRKFYQGDPSHSTRGNGVGLSLVRAIVELHGGTVVCSSDGEGTTFTVTLPLRPAAREE